MVMISEKIKEQIYTLRKQGLSLKKISDLLNISIATISTLCKLYDPIGKYKLTHKLRDEDKLDILQYYINNKNDLNKTVKHFTKFSRIAIRDYLVKSGKYEKKKGKKRKVDYLIDWKKRKKIELVNYKGGKCSYCGYNKCITALEFHHQDPLQKDFSISGSSYSIERMKQEVDKCILLCSNCHREEHEKLRKNGNK